MKETYLSVILTNPEITCDELQKLDGELVSLVRLHEIILVQSSTSKFDLSTIEFQGAVTVLKINGLTGDSRIRISGLGRAVGDFVFEWAGKVQDFPSKYISESILESAGEIELFEFQGSAKWTMNLSTNFLNRFRSSDLPLRRSIGVFYSRKMLNQILTRSAHEPEIDLLIGEIPKWLRIAKELPMQNSSSKEKSRFFELLTRGSSIGAAIPFLIAAVSAVTAFGAILYALSAFLFFGKTPQGWTTLMILIGLGQASITILLGFIWSKLNSIHNSLVTTNDLTSNWVVQPPKSIH